MVAVTATFVPLLAAVVVPISEFAVPLATNSWVPIVGNDAVVGRLVAPAVVEPDSVPLVIPWAVSMLAAQAAYE